MAMADEFEDKSHVGTSVEGRVDSSRLELNHLHHVSKYGVDNDLPRKIGYLGR